MISHKKCKEDGCTSPLYARGWCLHHYKILYLLPKQRNNPKRSYTIPKRTEKRTKQEIVYRDRRKEFIEKKRLEDKQKRIFCTFCGRVIEGDVDLHHGLGRDEDKLLREDDWFLAHRECHTDYHSKPYKKLVWWESYMTRILCNFLVRQRELRKMEK